MALQFEAAAASRFQFDPESYDWIPAFGVSFALGVDGIALVLSLLPRPRPGRASSPAGNDVDGAPRGSSRATSPDPRARGPMMIGVFAATDVFLFYVLFEAMLIPMYFLIGRYGGAQRSTRREVPPLLLVRRPAHARRRSSACTSSRRPARHGHLRLRRPRRPRHPRTAEVAVPRLLHRLRDQGAAVAAAHLAARRRRRGDPRHRGAAGRRAGQGRHLRDAPLLPAAVPRRLDLHAPGVIVLAVVGISTARCWRSARPTSSASSPTRRCRTSASSRWASSR
jgi:hypothetical protein